MSEQKTQSRFVDAVELCGELGICKRTLGRMVESGRFPQPLRVGLRKRLWLRVEAYAALGVQETTKK